jgi:30S ribosomal protein S31
MKLFIFGKNNLKTMGKGDKKSRKGKIWRGSFGKRRPKKKK